LFSSLVIAKENFYAMRTLFFFIIFAIHLIHVQGQTGISNKIPPNEPAQVEISGNNLIIRYNGNVILNADISNEHSDYYFREVKDEENGAIHHSFTLTSNSRKEIKITGIIYGSEQSFPCEENRNIGSTFVRHSYGLSHSLLNKAVYDRKNDWSFSVEQANVKIEPISEAENENQFKIEISGSEICFLFKPRYYQKHRGLKFFEPWNYNVWNKSVAGWCSWFAFFKDVKENDIKEVTDLLAEKLGPYGLEYIQIDDGYQQEGSLPENWINSNKQFPSGMDQISKYISDKGFKPGIWTYASFHNNDFALKNKSLFITDDNGEPVKGRWVGYSMDGSNPATISTFIKPTYSHFKNTGWKYFKVDGLRHLMYEGYNSNSGYFQKKKTDRVEAFRNIAKAIRNEIGKDNFMLACWGIRPELIGIADACRIGDDGFGLRTLTQYNSFNNVVWRNDPDHIELSEKSAYQSCMVTSMTGSLFMLTDKAPVYKTEIIEAARQSIPVLFTKPGQIYDIDPSCSMYMDRVGSQLSGSGSRIFDARYASPYTHFITEINTPYENWLLLGRTDECRKNISFAELGLNKKKEYLVFEFWSKDFMGIFSEDFIPGEIDAKYNCQLFCIREKQPVPQLLATNRHISCGGLEIEELKWEGKSLNGISSMVAKDKYSIYIYEPQGFLFKSFNCDGVELIENKIENNIRKITFRSENQKSVKWNIDYQ
jgi:alpha-galactosidase